MAIEAKAGISIGDRYLNEILQWAKTGTAQLLLNTPTVLASMLEWAFIIPLFVYFFMQDQGRFKKAFLKIVPNIIFERFYGLVHQF